MTTDAAPVYPAPDPDALKMFSFAVFSKLEGAVTAGMIHLGDRLGLYRALAAGPATAAELAARTGYHERWVREWAHNQAAAKLLTIEHGDGAADAERFGLTPEAITVFVDENHPAFGMGMFHRLPQTMSTLDHLPESFRTGVGYDYDAHGEEGAVGIERSFAPWFRNFLVPVALPALGDDGEIVRRLQEGAVVADIGCGTGVALVTMAAAYPNSRFHGYDISQHALARAEAKRAHDNVNNVSFHNPKWDPLPADNSIDLITTFDCIHDMTHPQEVMSAIRTAIADDGVWLLVDIKGRETFAENVLKNPMASLMYGISVMSCMSSALSEPGGAGLGTLGLPESVARAMAEKAGFTRFRKLGIEHSVNSFYEVRP